MAKPSKDISKYFKALLAGEAGPLPDVGGPTGTVKAQEVIDLLVKTYKKGRLPARKREAILEALAKVSPVTAKELALQIPPKSTPRLSIEEAPKKDLSSASRSVPIKGAVFPKDRGPKAPAMTPAEQKKLFGPLAEKPKIGAAKRAKALRADTVAGPPGAGKFRYSKLAKQRLAMVPPSAAPSISEAVAGEAVAGKKTSIIGRLLGGARKHPIAAGLGLLGLGAVVAPQIGEFRERMSGSAFDDEMERMVLEEQQARAQDARRQRLQQAMSINTARLAQTNPHIYNEALAGRRLPKGAVVLGGQPESAVLDELTMAMALNNPNAQGDAAKTQLQALVRTR